MARLHLILALAWALTALPAVLFWSESILFVALLQVYQVAAIHWSAYESARAEKEVEKLEGR